MLISDLWLIIYDGFALVNQLKCMLYLSCKQDKKVTPWHKIDLFC